jgi:hypothetical protein
MKRETVSFPLPFRMVWLTDDLPAALASNKLQAIFATSLLRRKKDSMLDGKRLIELPDKTVDLLKLKFSGEERAVYKMASLTSLL